MLCIPSSEICETRKSSKKSSFPLGKNYQPLTGINSNNLELLMFLSRRRNSSGCYSNSSRLEAGLKEKSPGLPAIENPRQEFHDEDATIVLLCNINVGSTLSFSSGIRTKRWKQKQVILFIFTISFFTLLKRNKTFSLQFKKLSDYFVGLELH